MGAITPIVGGLLESGLSARNKINYLIDLYNKIAVSDPSYVLERVDPTFIKKTTPTGQVLSDAGTWVNNGAQGLGGVLTESNHSDNIDIVSPDGGSTLSIVDGIVRMRYNAHGNYGNFRSDDNGSVMDWGDGTAVAAITQSPTDTTYAHNVKNKFISPLNEFGSTLTIDESANSLFCNNGVVLYFGDNNDGQCFIQGVSNAGGSRQFQIYTQYNVSGIFSGSNIIFQNDNLTGQLALSSTWDDGVSIYRAASVLVDAYNERVSVNSSGEVRIGDTSSLTIIGVGGNITQLNGNVIVSSASANRVSYFNASKQLVSSAITDTELSYLSGANSNIQNQINNINTGLKWKNSARVLCDTNITIASPTSSLDGVTMALNDRVVLNGQSTGSQNGVYVWNGAAVPMTRATDCDTSAELVGMTITIEEGTYADQMWMLSTNAPITVGATTLLYIKSSSTTYTGSNGITLTGNNFTLDNSYFSGAFTLSGGIATIGAGYVTNTMLAGSIDYTKLSAMTSANFSAIISDETGSGSLVFANAPTLTNPIVGTQTAGDNSTKAASTAFVHTEILHFKKNIFLNCTPTGNVTSGTTNTLIQYALIPANTITGNNKKVIIKAESYKAGSAGAGTQRMYLNTVNNLTGSPTLIGTQGTSAVNVFAMVRSLKHKSAGNTIIINPTFSLSSDEAAVLSTTFTTISPDWTVDQYILITGQCVNGSDSMSDISLEVEFIQ